MKIELDGDKLVVHSTPLQVELMKRVPGAKYDASRQVWTVPARYPLWFALRGEFPGKLDPDEATRAWVAEQWQLWEAMPHGAYNKPNHIPLDDGKVLAPLQEKAVNWLLYKPRAILADDMGTGKTVMASVYAHITLGDKTIIVCPKSLTGSWVSHLYDWGKFEDVFLAVGGAVQRRKAIAAFGQADAGALVINYSTLASHTRLMHYGGIAFRTCPEHKGIDPKVTAEKCQVHLKDLNAIDYDMLICDEAHRLKDPTTIQTRAAWWLSKQADYVLAMTGTPISNAPDDFWALLRLVDPDSWPAKGRFLNRYCLMGENYASGGSYVVGLDPVNNEEFHRIKNMYMLRRTFNEVSPHKIEKVYYTREIELTGKKKSLYKKLKTEPLIEMDGQILMLDNPAVVNSYLQIASSGANLELNEEGKLKMVSMPTKVNELWDMWNDIGRVPLVVMAGGSGSRQLLDKAMEFMTEKRVPYAQVVGGMSTQARTENVDSYMSGHVDLFFGQSQAAGEGLNLDRGNQIVFLQRSYSYVETRQAEDRVRRMTQKADTVLVTDIVSKGTLDGRLHAVLNNKDSLFEEFTQDAEKMKELW